MCVLTCAYILHFILLHDTTCIITIMMSSDIIMHVIIMSVLSFHLVAHHYVKIKLLHCHLSVKYCNLHINGTDGAYF